MIFGNPSKFAIYVDEVKDWSSPSFIEGLFFYIIECRFCPRLIPDDSCTIGAYIDDLACTEKNKRLNGGYENSRLFNLPIEQAYIELDAKRFIPFEDGISDVVEEDWTYSIALLDMLWHGMNGDIYLISHEAQEKILYKDPDTGEVLETILEKDYVVKVMQEAIAWWNSLNIARVAPISKA